MHRRWRGCRGGRLLDGEVEKPDDSGVLDVAEPEGPEREVAHWSLMSATVILLERLRPVRGRSAPQDRGAGEW